MSKQKDQFIALLGELFQLNQPELDFGLYRILHARSAQIKAFIDTELGSEIDAHFAEQSQSNAHDSLEAARVKVAETLGEDAFLPTGELKPEYRGTKVGKEFELAQQQARDGGGVLADDAQVYEHLYRFFSRYYDKGDFMSKRYFVAENDSRAAPYAVPYDGREVMLHWANKDQYYIKSSEALSNFTFDLSTAQAKEQGQQSGFDFQPAHATPLKVHFRLAAAAEGEHNNVKEGQERFFIIHAAEPLKLETNDKGLPELVIQFDYRPDHEKTGQAATWQQKRLAEAEQVIGDQLAKLASATQQLSNSATQQLSNSATQQLSNSATQQLSNSATQQLSNSATQQLSNSATQQLSNSATQQLSNSATQQLSSSATQQLSNSAAQQLDSATQQLSNSATQQLSNSATQQLSNSAAQQLSNSATQQLSNSATQQLSNSATQQLSNSATQQLSNSATQQLSNSATQQLSNSATQQLSNSATQHFTFASTH
ncbi:hypothetical protein ACSMFT_08320 [Ectopseudomonas oleovorans]|uniref:hypothetical protein n=1 Tax=Ectopseudomonas oleovorans TaxID=301 RepID=UPI003F1E32BA